MVWLTEATRPCAQPRNKEIRMQSAVKLLGKIVDAVMTLEADRRVQTAYHSSLDAEKAGMNASEACPYWLYCLQAPSK